MKNIGNIIYAVKFEYFIIIELLIVKIKTVESIASILFLNNT